MLLEFRSELRASYAVMIAYNALKEALEVMMAQIIPGTSYTIPLPSNTMDSRAIVEQFFSRIKESLGSPIAAVA